MSLASIASLTLRRRMLVPDTQGTERGSLDSTSADLIAGNNFYSYNDVAPYLEPPGSGISSLWARTIALKHNTCVVVGYPEQRAASCATHTRAGPEHFNSAILVNGDGETVVNYRQHFLHSADEAWATEGRGFFHDRVPGLGSAVIGIG